MTKKITSKDVLQIRTDAGLTRREFAAEMEVTEMTIYLWETSQKQIRIHPGNASKLSSIGKKYSKDGAGED